MQTILDGMRWVILLLADVLAWILVMLGNVLLLILKFFLIALVWFGTIIEKFLKVLEYLTEGTWFGWYVFELHWLIPTFTFVAVINLFGPLTLLALRGMMSLFKRNRYGDDSDAVRFYRIDEDGAGMGIFITDEDIADGEPDEDGYIYRDEKIYKAIPNSRDKIPTSAKIAGAGLAAYGGYKMGAKLANWLTK